MKEKDIKTYIYSIIVVISFILVTVGSSLAIVYYTVTGNETNGDVDVKTAYVLAEFHEIQGFNDDDIFPGWSNEMKFAIVNTSTEQNAVGKYSIYWDIEKNELNSSDFIYSLTGTSTLNGVEIEEDIYTNKLIKTTLDKVVPSVSIKLGEGLINTGVRHDYTLKVTFVETGVSQNDLQGKTFKASIVAKGE